MVRLSKCGCSLKHLKDEFSTGMALRDGPKRMDLENQFLKHELKRTRDNLRSAKKRCCELICELDTLTACHNSESHLRDQQLSRIYRALLVLESRLKQEQKSIRQQLYDKDTVIRNQQLVISRLKRCTKNYIKNEKDHDLNPYVQLLTNPEDDKTMSQCENESIGKNIQKLKYDIISKFNNENDAVHENKIFGVQKTDSFGESDISKDSFTSEATDFSIITTTTEGSPSLMSTEGFFEGESTDISPVSTLNKCSQLTKRTIDNDAEITTIVHDPSVNQTRDKVYAKNQPGITRFEYLDVNKSKVENLLHSSVRNEDGMDCNYASDKEDNEPLYINASYKSNTNNFEESDCHTFTKDNNITNNNVSLNVNSRQEKNVEETSGNWYSDPDEDRINDEVCRNNSYRPNSNHNSVLECVNQILLRDMDEEENVISVPRIFKHRGRIVRFQPARLSDIESVGSEMERRNSEEITTDCKDPDSTNFEATPTDNEFGLKLSSSFSPNVGSETSDANDFEDLHSNGAIPIVIIEPPENVAKNRDTYRTESELLFGSNSSINRSSSSILKLEKIGEKVSLSMSPKGLTLANNLDYENIESLPEIVTSPIKIPPALPPKPQFRNNTLILKKIPSPSFLIDETKKKHNYNSSTPSYVKNIFGTTITSPKSSTGSSRSLVFEVKVMNNITKDSSVQSTFVDNKNVIVKKNMPRVTNIVNHFEEFKIGSEIIDNIQTKLTKERKPPPEIEELDIRQNFEEFNLDDCDLLNDPNRPDGDGSEHLNVLSILPKQDNSLSISENNNSGYQNNNSSGIYDNFLEATGLSTKSILTPRLLSNHKSMLKPKHIKYKNKIKSVGTEKHYNSNSNSIEQLPESEKTHVHVRHWTGPFV